jgi:hypothetical protein
MSPLGCALAATAMILGFLGAAVLTAYLTGALR